VVQQSFSDFASAQNSTQPYPEMKDVTYFWPRITSS